MRAKSTKILNTVLIAALALLAAVAAVRWLLPFLIACAAAAALEPLVGRLCRRGMARGIAAGMCLIALLAAAVGLLWLLLSRLTGELSALAARFPEILSAISALLERWESALADYLERAPEGLGLWLEGALADAVAGLAKLPGILSTKLLGVLPGMAAAAPETLLFAITTVIGTYFISASYPELLHLAARQLPERFLCRARLLRRDLRRTLGRWLRAQLILLAITFGLLAAAFALLGVSYALLLALTTALIDALPVLGTGTVLLPWAGYAFLTGDVPLGVGLVITYAAVTVLHQSIQAKLLGDQLGLHPLAMLAAIYVGFRVWGVWGMLSFPLLAVCLKQVLDSGILRRPQSGVQY